MGRLKYQPEWPMTKLNSLTKPPARHIYLKLEQETERAHHVLNILEVRFKSVKNKAMNYFFMLKAFKNIKIIHWKPNINSKKESLNNYI